MLTAALAAGSLAAPVYPRANTLEQLLVAIAPKTTSCDGAPAAGQCRTAAQAAGPIQKSFDTYGITTNSEKAALISLMAFETGGFKYNENMFPGRPGQGTRNMQMINFNVLYAQSLPCMAEDLAKAAGASSGINAAALTPQQANAVRKLLTEDEELDFGSAAWFLTTQCTAEVRKALQTKGVDGWSKYITECIGTTVADRQPMFTAALQALGG